MPIGANLLMNKYNIPEGKTLGSKLKMIEETLGIIILILLINKFKKLLKIKYILRL